MDRRTAKTRCETDRYARRAPVDRVCRNACQWALHSNLLRPLLVASLLNSACLISIARPQTEPRGFGLEVHAGYGGGGLHPDELVGGGLTYHLGLHSDATGFLTAVVARPGGRTVFAGLGVRVGPLRGAVRPYLAVGPLLTIRAYAEDHLGAFGNLGVEAPLERRWRVFVEGRLMGGGGSWTQLVGGVRYH
jgi:hypothetical protein